MSKNVALVLGSGGARGLAHIGAIEALEERGYTITSIAGCSMGSIIAGMYAAGQLKEAKEWFLSVDKQLILRMMDINLLSGNSLVKGQRIIKELQKVVPDRMNRMNRLGAARTHRRRIQERKAGNILPRMRQKNVSRNSLPCIWPSASRRISWS